MTLPLVTQQIPLQLHRNIFKYLSGCFTQHWWWVNTSPFHANIPVGIHRGLFTYHMCILVKKRKQIIIIWSRKQVIKRPICDRKVCIVCTYFQKWVKKYACIMWTVRNAVTRNLPWVSRQCNYHNKQRLMLTS